MNGDATPFIPSESGDNANQTYGTFTLKVPLDSKVWKTISAANTHRIMGPKKLVSPQVIPTNVYPELQISRNLSTEVSSDGLISVRRNDNVS